MLKEINEMFRATTVLPSTLLGVTEFVEATQQ